MSRLLISRNSWHYRMWSAGRSSYDRPRNLCRYFWYIFGQVAILLFLAGLALVGLGALLYAFVTKPVTSFIVTGSIILGIGLLWVLIYGMIKYFRRMEEKDRQHLEALRRGEIPHPKPKEPSALRLWLKARKEKYCPLIEVVDKTHPPEKT